jgi:acetyl-CoA carboxylase biotin carboxyl carrier protein
VELNINELRELVAALSQSDVAELTLKSSTFELTLRKQGVVTAASLPTVVVAPETVASSPTKPVEVVPPAVEAAAPTTPPATPPGKHSDLLTISSPMVGTFYRSPAPDEPPFVNVGDRVSTGQAVCIIEAMKLMNELESEVSGEIVEILANNAEPVEFGQALMLVRPN